MRSRRQVRLVPAVVAAVSAGCAVPHAAGPAPAVDSATCAARADSVLHAYPGQPLPFARLEGPVVRVPAPADDGQSSNRYGFTFLVRPDGVIDTSSVAVNGTADPAYRVAVLRFLGGRRAAAPVVGGCPVWGTTGIFVERLGQLRRRTRP